MLQGMPEGKGKKTSKKQTKVIKKGSTHLQWLDDFSWLKFTGTTDKVSSLGCFPVAPLH